MSQKMDWGVPDWTTLDGYPAPDGPQEMCIWAWEFLRRWDGYRTFWKEKIESFIGPGGYIMRDAQGNFWPYHNELKKNFGVDVPSPPTSSTPAFFVERYTTWVENDGRETQQICLEEHQIAIIFDLSRLLKPQFERAEATAKREQEFRRIKPVTARGRKELYVQYLRILDGIDSGARPKDIGARLFPGLSDEHPDCRRQKRFSDSQQAAERLRDGGYRSLLIA